MNVERFDRAIAVIKGIPNEQLNLTVWQEPYGMTKDWIYKYIVRAGDATCGTICCAGGWLCLQPEMQAQGLSLSELGMPMYDDGQKKYRLFDALQRFFGITENESFSLFGKREDREYQGEFALLSDREVWLTRAMELKSRYESDHPTQPE